MLLEYQNTKIFLQKFTLQFGMKFLWLKKFNILCHRHMLIMILMEKKLLELFTKKNQKTNQKEFRIEKVIREKVISYMLNWNDTIIHLIVG